MNTNAGFAPAASAAEAMPTGATQRFPPCLPPRPPHRRHAPVKISPRGRADCAAAGRLTHEEEGRGTGVRRTRPTTRGFTWGNLFVQAVRWPYARSGRRPVVSVRRTRWAGIAGRWVESQSICTSSMGSARPDRDRCASGRVTAVVPRAQRRRTVGVQITGGSRPAVNGVPAADRSSEPWGHARDERECRRRRRWKC